MKHLSMIGSCAICFLLGTLVPLTRTHAQTEASNPTFCNISFMKTRPGQNPINMEREL
jgi:hypothetical protein